MSNDQILRIPRGPLFNIHYRIKINNVKFEFTLKIH